MGRKISEMSDEQRRDYLDQAYAHACNLHAAGELGQQHPSKTVIDWSKRGKAYAAAADANGNGRTESEMLESHADPAFAANTGTPKTEKLVSVDGQLEYDAVGNARFLASDGRIFHGADAMAAAQLQIKDETAARMEPAVPGYGRLK